ncbi:MAG: hypothetical protein RIS94_702 [Pseudomonadota bacterium]|jgi:hypothetical protein
MQLPERDEERARCRERWVMVALGICALASVAFDLLLRAHRF